MAMWKIGKGILRYPWFWACAVGQEMGCCVQKMEFMESACGALH